MIREKITDEWRWSTGTPRSTTSPTKMREIQAAHGVGAIGGITSSRTTNEEVYVVQKMVRAAFGNNNVDTCARVCHSPTGYGLKQTFGESAGTQDFRSVAKADVIVVIGANPTDGHPVFASRMKRRLREGAKLIVIDPRRIDLVRSPHVEAAVPPAARTRHQRRHGQRDGPRRSSPRAWSTEAFVDDRCEGFDEWAEFIARPGEQPGGRRGDHRRPRRGRARGRPAVRHRRQRRDLLRPRRHRAQPGLDHGDGHGQPGHGHRQHRPRRRRRQPAARPEQRAGLLRHGLVPARAARLPARLRRRRARGVREPVGQHARWPSPACASRTCSTPRSTARSAALFVQGEDIAQSDPNTSHVYAALKALDLLVVQDLFLNETAQVRPRVPARHVVPGEGRHVHQRRAPDQPGAPGDGAADRQARVADRRARSRRRWATRCRYDHPSEIMDEIAALTPTFARRLVRQARRARQRPVAVQRRGARRARRSCTSTSFVRGKGRFVPTTVRADHGAQPPASSR